MAEINVDYLKKCIETMEISLFHLQRAAEDSIEYEMYRNSLVKGFELTLEQSGKLLKKKMTAYFATKKQADSLTFKDIFRYAAKHGLLTSEETERWLIYRDNRNSTAHNYGQHFADVTVQLAENFLQDARKLLEILS